MYVCVCARAYICLRLGPIYDDSIFDDPYLRRPDLWRPDLRQFQRTQRIHRSVTMDQKFLVCAEVSPQLLKDVLPSSELASYEVRCINHKGVTSTCVLKSTFGVCLTQFGEKSFLS